MENRGYKEIKDVEWQHVGCETGQIKFSSSRKSRKIKSFFKTVALIMIAAVSGGVSGAYIVQKKYTLNVNTSPATSIFNTKEANVESSDVPRSAVTMVAESIGPAVVGISNKAEGFFGEVDNGSGSGIIFDNRGYIVTNYHVIEGASSVNVKLPTGKVLAAKYIGADPRSDLAVIKIEGQNLPTAKLGDSSKVKVGDLAVAIGNPLGEEFAGTVTAGIISAVNRKIKYGNTKYQLLQTDAAINPGNSGGALCNEAGEVIGINSLKIGGSSGADGTIEGIGFAIAINEAKDVIKSLMDSAAAASTNNSGKDQSKVYLGILGGDAVPGESSGVRGAYIQEVIPDSGASAAGIRPTDIIVELDGVKITKFDDLAKVTNKHKVGDTIICKIWRNGKILQVNIILSERKDK